MIELNNVDEKLIKFFLNSIRRGPFYFRNDHKRLPSIEEIVSNQKKKNKIFFSADEDANIYECVVYQGYLDMNRTSSGEGKENECRMISNYLKNYFENNVKLDIVDIIKSEGVWTPGQRQKVLNMAFKYLFCVKEYNDDKEKFSCCDIPIDGYILKWIELLGIKTEENGNSRKIKDITWSTMTADEYYYIQEEVKKIISDKTNNKNVQLLYYDFIVWPYMRFILSTEEILKLKDEIEDIGEEADSLEKKMKELKEKIGISNMEI